MLQYTCATTVGGRKNNQDNLLINGEVPFESSMNDFSAYGNISDEDTVIFAVCDGIGGLDGGAEASLHAVKMMAAHTDFVFNSDDPAERIVNLLDDADEKIRSVLSAKGYSGGSTASVVVIRNNECFIVNVGDSPVYILQSDDKLHELSFRHNLASYKKLAGYEPDKGDESVLIYAVGTGETKPSNCANIARGSLKNGDMLLLCSDGITNAFSEEDIAYVMGRGVTAKQLVEKAGELDGADNCTAVIVKYYE